MKSNSNFEEETKKIKLTKAMRNNILKLSVVLLLVTQLFYGCNSDDEPSNDGNISGTWRMTSMDYEGESSTVFQGVPLTITFEGEGKNLDVTMTFTESPDEFTTAGSYDVELSSTIFGQTETETISVEDFDSNGTWSRSGNTLTLDGSLFALSISGEADGNDLGSGDMVIEQLDNSTLKLSVETTEDFTQDGVEASATITSTIEFARE